MNKKLISVIAYVIIFNSISVLVGCQNKSEKTKHIDELTDEQKDKLRKGHENRDVSINISGKVIDQNGDPVEGVQLVITITKNKLSDWPFSTWVEKKLQTNSHGEFRIRNESGSEVRIAGGINKKGFEPMPEENSSHSFNYSSKFKQINAPDPNKLVIIRLRKLGETTHVLHRGAVFEFKPEQSGTEKGYDFIRGIDIEGEDLKTLRYNDSPMACDLKVKAVLDPATSVWSVFLSTGTQKGGILTTDKFLYEAPKEGYQPSLTLCAEPAGPKVRCLFIRSRWPYIYTRIDVGRDFGVEGKPFVRAKGDTRTTFSFGGSATVNPYGERNLEEDKELPSDITSKLENDIRASYRLDTSGRPPKPDLPKLVQEWEKSRPLKDKVKEWLLK